MTRVHKLVLTALFLALGLVLPLLVGQVPTVGKMLLPMHIPVFLCAFICGKQPATAMAFLLPLVRYALVSLPQMPLIVAGELATYAFVAGWLYERRAVPTLRHVFGCLAAAMVAGRAVRAVLQSGFLWLVGAPGAIPVFFADTMLVGLVGGALQLVLLPPLICMAEKCAIIKKE